MSVQARLVWSEYGFTGQWYSRRDYLLLRMSCIETRFPSRMEGRILVLNSTV